MKFLNKFSGIPLAVQRVIDEWSLSLNGRISLGDGVSKDNIDGVWVTTITPAPAGTAFVLNHNLGRIPAGWLVAGKSATTDIFSSGAVTTNTISLAATTTGVTVKLFIF